MRLLPLLVLVACTPTPSTKRPITNAGPVLELLGVRGQTEVYAVENDPDCHAERYAGFPALSRDPGTGVCFGGLTLGSAMWLAVKPGMTFAESAISHEARHRLGHGHDGLWDWPAGSDDAVAIAAGKVAIAAAGFSLISAP